jgi:hypothetical protein
MAASWFTALNGEAGICDLASLFAIVEGNRELGRLTALAFSSATSLRSFSGCRTSSPGAIFHPELVGLGDQSLAWSNLPSFTAWRAASAGRLPRAVFTLAHADATAALVTARLPASGAAAWEVRQASAQRYAVSHARFQSDSPVTEFGVAVARRG